MVIESASLSPARVSRRGEDTGFGRDPLVGLFGAVRPARRASGFQVQVDDGRRNELPDERREEADEEEDEPATGGGREAEHRRDSREANPVVVVHAGDEIAGRDGRLGRLLLEDEPLLAHGFQERLVGDVDLDAVGGRGEGRREGRGGPVGVGRLLPEMQEAVAGAAAGEQPDQDGEGTEVVAFHGAPPQVSGSAGGRGSLAREPWGAGETNGDRGGRGCRRGCRGLRRHLRL